LLDGGFPSSFLESLEKKNPELSPMVFAFAEVMIERPVDGLILLQQKYLGSGTINRISFALLLLSVFISTNKLRSA